MTNPETIVDRCFANWNEAEATRRQTLIAALWAPQGRYSDPLMSGEGHDGIARLIESARAQFPGLVFTPRAGAPAAAGAPAPTSGPP